jgi:hypothetical protein
LGEVDRPEPAKPARTGGWGHLSFLFAALPLALAAACSVSETSAGVPGDGGVTGDGGDSGEGGIIKPPDCDLTKEPKDSPACVDDGVAVFVSPTGDDATSGRKASPVKSIAKGVELAAARGVPRVYVCEGSYDGAVDVKAPVAIFGGMSCAWAVTGARPKLAPSKGVALAVTKVSGAVLVQDLEIVGSADLGKPGDSAIAAFVSESTNVTFRNVTLTAKDGVGGATGAARSNHSGAVASKGANAGGATGGVATTCTCTDGNSSTGGAGASGAGAGIQNGSSVPAVGGANAGSSSATTCTDGQVGADGAAAGTGAAATTAGSLIATGWNNAATGPAAPNGNPGQGGGGGGGKTDVSSAGGGGACGGCGGGGGAVGGNGGSSFALLSFKSGVTFDGGSLTTGAGGRGGDGGAGQSGQSGGALGVGSACNGGPGGHGAGGSGGGGGAGGHSVPVAWVGNEPTLKGAQATPGAKGSGGGGGTPGAGPGNAGGSGATGPDGKAQPSLGLP